MIRSGDRGLLSPSEFSKMAAEHGGYEEEGEGIKEVEAVLDCVSVRTMDY